MINGMAAPSLIPQASCISIPQRPSNKDQTVKSKDRPELILANGAQNTMKDGKGDCQQVSQRFAFTKLRSYCDRNIDHTSAGQEAGKQKKARNPANNPVATVVTFPVNIQASRPISTILPFMMPIAYRADNSIPFTAIRIMCFCFA